MVNPKELNLACPAIRQVNCGVALNSQTYFKLLNPTCRRQVNCLGVVSAEQLHQRNKNFVELGLTKNGRSMSVRYQNFNRFLAVECKMTDIMNLALIIGIYFIPVIT